MYNVPSDSGDRVNNRIIEQFAIATEGTPVKISENRYRAIDPNTRTRLFYNSDEKIFSVSSIFNETFTVDTLDQVFGELAELRKLQPNRSFTILKEGAEFKIGENCILTKIGRIFDKILDRCRALFGKAPNNRFSHSLTDVEFEKLASAALARKLNTLSSANIDSNPGDFNETGAMTVYDDDE